MSEFTDKLLHIDKLSRVLEDAKPAMEREAAIPRKTLELHQQSLEKLNSMDLELKRVNEELQKANDTSLRAELRSIKANKKSWIAIGFSAFFVIALIVEFISNYTNVWTYFGK